MMMMIMMVMMMMMGVMMMVVMMMVVMMMVAMMMIMTTNRVSAFREYGWVWIQILRRRDNDLLVLLPPP